MTFRETFSSLLVPLNTLHLVIYLSICFFFWGGGCHCSSKMLRFPVLPVPVRRKYLFLEKIYILIGHTLFTISLHSPSSSPHPLPSTLLSSSSPHLLLILSSSSTLLIFSSSSPGLILSSPHHLFIFSSPHLLLSSPALHLFLSSSSIHLLSSSSLHLLLSSAAAQQPSQRAHNCLQIPS